MLDRFEGMSRTELEDEYQRLSSEVLSAELSEIDAKYQRLVDLGIFNSPKNTAIGLRKQYQVSIPSQS